MFRYLKNQLMLLGAAVVFMLLGAVYLLTRGHMIAACTVVTCACILIIGIWLWFFFKVMLPLEKLRETAGRIASGSYGIQADKAANDELGELTEQINLLSEKVGMNERAMTEFVSQVSHELRTPLTAIQGWAETIAYDPAVKGDSLRGINIIQKEAERLTTMVKEMLEFSRIQDGRFNLRIESIDIASELEDALFTYGELMKQAGVELDYKMPDEDLPPISADPERLKQVFLNLLDNAKKHGGEGGKVEVALSGSDGFVTITIRDHGRGIPEAELPHVKEKFYKGSSKNRGTGIGLAVCDEICMRHGGELRIENAPGGGCLATIILPEKNGDKHAR